MVFFAEPAKLGSIWLTVFHLPRGVIGFILLKFLPKSHEIVQDLDFDGLEHAQISIEKIYEKVKFSLSI